MKVAQLRSRARADIFNTTRWYRREASAAVARRFARAVREALAKMEHEPGLGSPRLGHDLDVPGLRAWRVIGFPVAIWYFEGRDHLDVARLVGERQDPDDITLVPEADN